MLFGGMNCNLWLYSMCLIKGLHFSSWYVVFWYGIWIVCCQRILCYLLSCMRGWILFFSSFFYVVLSGDNDCLCRSKDRVLHILHALAYSMCLIGSLRLVVLCLKMLPGDMDWLSSKGRVCYKSCMRGCIPPYVSVSHVCVCVCVCESEEWRNSLMSAPGDIQVTCIVYYCFSLGCF